MITLLQIVIIVFGIFLLVKGADWMVDGATGIADLFHIPNLVIGFTIVAMGTSIPEAAVSMMGVYRKNDALAMGNILGSNIVNILLILGICGLIAPVTVRKNTIRFEIPFMILVTAMFAGLSLNDGVLELHDGVYFGIAFLVYLVYIGIHAKKHEELYETKQGEEKRSLSRHVMFVTAGIVVVFLASEMIVSSAEILAKSAHMTNRLVALTILALVTSLPELFTSISAVKKKKNDIVIGNIIGSNIFNILFVCGVSTAIRPVMVSKDFVEDIIVALVAAIALFIVVIPKKKLNYISSVMLLLGYVVYAVCRSAGL